MAGLTKLQSLTVVIPILNEAENLPLLLADLHLWPGQIEILIIDGGSTDHSQDVATLGGAKFFQSLKANRGFQLHYGACKAENEWILFLHADCRLNSNWPQIITSAIKKDLKKITGFFFNLKIDKKALDIFLVECAVFVRSNIFNTPYGDQGLLISKELYEKVGGYKPLYLMEDIDFINRLKKKGSIKSLDLDIYSNSRGWKETNAILKAIKNANLRRLWMSGTSTKILSKKYYEQS